MRKSKAERIVAEVMEHNPDGLDIGVLDGYEPSAGELDNIVYLVCRYTCGWNMCGADLAICLQMAGEVKGAKGISSTPRPRRQKEPRHETEAGQNQSQGKADLPVRPL